jgi:hypothetical protein
MIYVTILWLSCIAIVLELVDRAPVLDDMD